MRLDFYYYSYQCPLNDNMLQLLAKYEDKIDIRYYDISDDFDLAKKMNIFFPTLTVLDAEKRYYSPIYKDFLEQVVAGEYPKEKPYLPVLSNKIVTKHIEPLTENNIFIACDCCANKTENNWCEKVKFLKLHSLEPFGFIHTDDDKRLLGGAEYLPSTVVPYDIPRDKQTAFLTCTY